MILVSYILIQKKSSDQKHMDTNKESTTNDDTGDLTADSHRIVASSHQMLKQYDLLILGYIRSHEWIIPVDMIAICKSYLPLEFRMIEESNQSNFYMKRYQAYNIFDNPIGPSIIDHNQRRREIIIHNLYTFSKNSYIDADIQTDITEYKLTQYQINRPILNKRILGKNGNVTIQTLIKVSCDDHYQNILNKLAHAYDTNSMDILRQFKNVNIDLKHWFD